MKITNILLWSHSLNLGPFCDIKNCTWLWCVCIVKLLYFLNAQLHGSIIDVAGCLPATARPAFQESHGRNYAKNDLGEQSTHPPHEHPTCITKTHKASLQSSCGSKSASLSLLCICCWILYSINQEHNIDVRWIFTGYVLTVATSSFQWT